MRPSVRFLRAFHTRLASFRTHIPSARVPLVRRYSATNPLVQRQREFSSKILQAQDASELRLLMKQVEEQCLEPSSAILMFAASGAAKFKDFDLAANVLQKSLTHKIPLDLASYKQLMILFSERISAARSMLKSNTTTQSTTTSKLREAASSVAKRKLLRALVKGQTQTRPTSVKSLGELAITVTGTNSIPNEPPSLKESASTTDGAHNVTLSQEWFDQLATITETFSVNLEPLAKAEDVSKEQQLEAIRQSSATGIVAALTSAVMNGITCEETLLPLAFTLLLKHNAFDEASRVVCLASMIPMPTNVATHVLNLMAQIWLVKLESFERRVTKTNKAIRKKKAKTAKSIKDSLSQTHDDAVHTIQSALRSVEQKQEAKTPLQSDPNSTTSDNAAPQSKRAPFDASVLRHIAKETETATDLVRLSVALEEHEAHIVSLVRLMRVMLTTIARREGTGLLRSFASQIVLTLALHNLKLQHSSKTADATNEENQPPATDVENEDLMVASLFGDTMLMNVIDSMPPLYPEKEQKPQTSRHRRRSYDDDDDDFDDDDDDDDRW